MLAASDANTTKATGFTLLRAYVDAHALGDFYADFLNSLRGPFFVTGRFAAITATRASTPASAAACRIAVARVGEGGWST